MSLLRKLAVSLGLLLKIIRLILVVIGHHKFDAYNPKRGS